MQAEILVLVIVAIAVAFLHTLSVPNHSLPFIALAKSRKWSLARTLFRTAVCGAGMVFLNW